MPERPRGGFNGETFYFKPAIPGSGLGEKIAFEAHIIGVTDTSTPDWGTYYDMGRADPVVMYNSMNRSINVSFIVVATDGGEHTQNYEKLKKLGNMTYPIYESGKGYNAPHVFYQIGRLSSGYGIITSLDYAWQGENPWIDDKPLMTDVTMNIKVLGDATGNRPEYQGGNYDYFGGS